MSERFLSCSFLCYLSGSRTLIAIHSLTWPGRYFCWWYQCGNRRRIRGDLCQGNLGSQSRRWPAVLCCGSSSQLEDKISPRQSNIVGKISKILNVCTNEVSARVLVLVNLMSAWLNDDNDNTNCTTFSIKMHGLKHFEPTRIGSYTQLYIKEC
jgi:hypothetical protein